MPTTTPLEALLGQNVLKPRTYQRRFICYFDVLGWRNHIHRAGDDPIKIATMHAVVQALAMGARPDAIEDSDPDIHYSSFSDHVVISRPLNVEHLPALLQSIGIIQIGIATIGFLLRGSVTIGPLYHDKDVVFGPGLVRAYDLESKEAIFPRIILDPLVKELREISAAFLTQDGSIREIDPYTLEFIEMAVSVRPPTSLMAEYRKSLGVELGPQNSSYSGRFILEVIRLQVERALQDSGESDAAPKLKWLSDRLATRVSTNAL